MKGLLTVLVLSADVLWGAVLSSAQAEGPRVVASIKPLQSLAAGVMDGIATPDVLVKGSASAHAYALRPSDAEALHAAEVIFWVGPAFETFFEKPLAALSGTARIIALLDAPGLRRLPARTGGLWDEVGEDDHAPPASARGEDRWDGHIWLDPANAKLIVLAMADTLSAVDPHNARQYHANAAVMDAQLDSLDGELRYKLAAVGAKPFVVYHDAYQYFETRYGLRAAGSVTVSAERTQGARRILLLKNRIAALDAARPHSLCVFAEPQFEPKLGRMLVSETGARVGVLDPEGSAHDPGRDLYFDLMSEMADNLAKCLTAP